MRNTYFYLILFNEGGNYRKHNVELGPFEPPTYFKVGQYMMD